MRKILGVFNNDFRALFFAQFAGTLNDNLFRTAFATFITYKAAGLTQGQASFFITAALAVYMLPYFLFSALAGEIADKYRKTTVIRFIKFTEIFTALLTALGFYLRSPHFLLFVLFIMGTQAAFFGPVRYSVIPQFLLRKQLIIGNAVMEAGRYLSILLGTLLGTALIASEVFGLASTFYILVFIALLGFFPTLLFVDEPVTDNKVKITPNILKGAARCLNFAYKSEKLFLHILAISWFWIVVAVMLAQLPDLSMYVLRGDAKVTPYLLTVFTLGIGFGALLCRKLLKSDVSIKYLPLSAFLMSIALLDLAFVILNVQTNAMAINLNALVTTFTGLRISVDLFIISACLGLYIVPLNTTLQVISGERVRSRIIAASNIVNTMGMVLASIVSMLLLKLGAGTPAIIAVLAFSNLVVAVYIIRLLPDYVLRSAAFIILNFLYDIKVHGLENYQNAGRRTLIIANNNSFLDPFLLAAFLPDDLTFVVDSTIAKRFWVRQVLRFVKHFAVDPTNPMAVKTIIDEIKKGRRIVIYPEGRIGTTNSVMKIYPGPAMIADHSDADIVPVFVHGTQYSRLSYYGRKLRHLPSSVPFTIHIMPPVRLDIAQDLKGRDRRGAAEDKVYDLMVDMKYRSFNLDITLFRALIEASDFAGRGARALEDVERKGLSYAKVLLGSFALGHQFAKLAPHGGILGVMLPNVNVFALTTFGLLAYGRVPAMINYTSGARNILSACKSAQITQIITSKAFIEKASLQEIAAAIEGAGIKLVYLEDIKTQVTFIDKLRAMAQSQLPYYAYRRTNPKPSGSSPAVILFTSGSEGVPKGVVLSHRNINANRFQLASLMELGGLRNKFFNALPMFHSFGLTCGLFIPILDGTSVFLYPSPLHYKIIPELVYDRNATVLFATDTFLNAYAKAAHPFDFHSVKYAAVGAEKLKDETFKIWSEKFGIRVLEAYGATEASPGISFTTAMHYKRGTVGRILPGMQYRLDKVPGIEEGGRFIIKGDNVMLGYLMEDAPGQIKPPKDGWYDTGDIVDVDADGFITIKGRAKRFAKIAGEMVSLTAVETALSKAWPDNLHAVVRLPDEKRGEQLLLWTTRPDLDLKQVQDSFKTQGLPELWVPRRIEYSENLPLMSTGKVNYVKLEEMSALLESGQG